MGVSGTVTCWGYNGSGQTSVPAGLAGVTQVSAGGLHTCVLSTGGAVACWGDNSYGQTTVPGLTTRVLPTAALTAPAAVVAGRPFALALGGAQVPGHPEATQFTYAFDCGDGRGYAAPSTAPSASCPTTAAGTRAVRGKVIDQSGDTAAYGASVLVTQAAQTVGFTSAALSPAYVGATYAPGAAATSGLAVTLTSLTPTTCTIAGTTVTFTAVGACTIAADQGGTTSYDPAPRVTRTIAVVYAFTGFFAPVNALPTVNTASAGQAIPLTFALGGNQGLGVLAAGAPTAQAVACQSGASTGTVTQAATAGASGLQYNAANAQYTYVWKTDKAWAGTCRLLTLTLADGTQHVASFQFTK